MDIVFDIDGTLSNAEHRLHHIIPDPNIVYEQPFKKDWGSFLSDEQIAKDAPIPQTWEIMTSLLAQGNRVLFITGRPTSQWLTTVSWLMDPDCPHRSRAGRFMMDLYDGLYPPIFMRPEGDRRPSHVVKREGLLQARSEGYDPKLVFEDRKDDTAMWRAEGLLCCQVAEGDY